MDQKLLDALNNISIALEQLSESLDKSKSPVKSDVGNSLQSGDFSKQLVEINEGIKSIKEDTKKILDNQETIIKLQKQQTSGESKVFEEAGGGKTKQMI
jgi:DNA replication protein DnaD